MMHVQLHCLFSVYKPLKTVLIKLAKIGYLHFLFGFFGFHIPSNGTTGTKEQEDDFYLP